MIYFAISTCFIGIGIAQIAAYFKHSHRENLIHPPLQLAGFLIFGAGLYDAISIYKTLEIKLDFTLLKLLFRFFQ